MNLAEAVLLMAASELNPDKAEETDEHGDWQNAKYTAMMI